MALIDDINDYIGTNALPSEFLPKGELEIYFDWKNRSYEEIEK
jgi:hypothetical protein